jgi:hypothetical protein
MRHFLVPIQQLVKIKRKSHGMFHPSQQSRKNQFLLLCAPLQTLRQDLPVTLDLDLDLALVMVPVCQHRTLMLDFLYPVNRPTVKLGRALLRWSLPKPRL